MSSGLGVAIGSTNSTAAICPSDQRDVRDSGLAVISYPSLLRLSSEAPPTLGARRVRSAAGEATDSVMIDGFAARVGDPVGILAADGATYAGEDLVATAVGCLVHEAAVEMKVDGPVIVACPPHWSAYTAETMRGALVNAGLSDATPVPATTAVLRWLKSEKGSVEPGAALVYDLGGSSLGVTVADTTDGRMLAEPVHTEEVSGAAFDHVVLSQVLANVAGTGLDPFDPATERVLAELRTKCTAAKERLSSDIETTLPVDIGGVRREVRLVRDEFEDLIRPLVTMSVQLARDVVNRAGITSGGLRYLVLVGGGASIPLVAELLSAEFGLPVTVSTQPQFAASAGAAMLAADTIAVTRTVVAPTAAPAAAPMSSAVSAARLAPVKTPKPIKPAAAAAVRGARRLGVIIGAAALVTALATGGLAVGTGIAPLPDPVLQIIGAEPTTTTPKPTTTAPDGAINEAATVDSTGDDKARGTNTGTSKTPGSTTTSKAPAAAASTTNGAPPPPPPPPSMPPPPTIPPPPSDAPQFPTLPTDPIQLPESPITIGQPVIELPSIQSPLG